MKLVVFAATGRIGRQIVEQALAAGHEVTAVARNPTGFPERVRTVTANLASAEPAALAAAVAGADAVLSGLGARKISEAGIAAVGTRAIIGAMRAAGVRRLVVVSASPVGTVPSPGRPNPPKHDPADSFAMRYLLGPLIKTLLRKVYADLAIMEDELRESDLDWTSVRPPRLTDKPLTGKYRTAIDENLPGGSTIARANVAHLMLAVLTRPETIKHCVGIAN